MGLLSLFQRNASKNPSRGAAARAAADPATAAEAVREARTRARRRLMGATVLLLAGIIGFPLLFETQPRPIPVDLPIEIPARNGAAPLVDAPASPRGAQGAGQASAQGPAGASPASAAAMPAATPATVAAVPSAPAVAAAPHEAAPAPQKAEPAKPAPQQAGPTPAAPTKKPAAPAPEPPKPAPVKPVSPKAAPATTVSTSSHDAAAAPPALSSGKPGDTPAVAASGHYVVQIGAFAEQAKAHDARMKVEHLGLKTYVQVIDTSHGRRIRVRVGPFGTKADADKAVARLKSAGLPADVLFLM